MDIYIDLTDIFIYRPGYSSSIWYRSIVNPEMDSEILKSPVLHRGWLRIFINRKIIIAVWRFIDRLAIT